MRSHLGYKKASVYTATSGRRWKTTWGGGGEDPHRSAKPEERLEPRHSFAKPVQWRSKRLICYLPFDYQKTTNCGSSLRVASHGMDQSPCEANSLQSPVLSCYRKFHCRVQKDPPLIPVLTLSNSSHSVSLIQGYHKRNRHFQRFIETKVLLIQLKYLHESVWLVTNVLCVSLLSHDRYQYDIPIRSEHTGTCPCEH
jgi:hypothetical protein